MTLDDVWRWLATHQVPERWYVLEGLGVGEAEGIGVVDGAWATYYSEHGMHGNLRVHDSEDAACRAFIAIIRERMLRLNGIDLPPPVMPRQD